MKRCVDRLSRSPDEVLIRILSFVSTRQAVQTCLLSKRWKNLWTSVPVLRFSESDDGFLHEGDIDRLIDFIDQVFAIRSGDVHISHYNFSYPSDVSAANVREWMLYATRGRNAEELTIDVGVALEEDALTYELPRSVFVCRSLRVLKLKLPFFCLPRTFNFNLSVLKTLQLAHITCDGDSLNKLLANCPSLEDLNLYFCGITNLNISSNLLKKLTIYWRGLSVESHIKVSLPSLVSFVYSGMLGARQHCSVNNFSSLVDVTITHACGDTLCSILGGIGNATSLKLENCQVEHLRGREVVGSLPEFHKLTYLELDTAGLSKNRMEAIINILQHSPNLQTLIISKINSSYEYFGSNKKGGLWSPEVIKSGPFLLFLRRIKMKGFKSSPLQPEFVRFILENAKSVKEITIIPESI